MPPPDWLSWEFWAKDSQSLYQLFLICVGLIGMGLLAWRTVAVNRAANAALEQAKTAAGRHEHQTIADRERRITESFAKAGEQLGSDKIETRLVGIYTLERIARESEREYWPIMETLTAFVRERAPWPPRQAPANPFVELQSSGADDTIGKRTADELENAAEPARIRVRPATDVQAVLTVLGRRDEQARKQDKGRLDLRGTDLRGATSFFKEVHLENADLTGAHLEDAELYGAHLEYADLTKANLDRAKLAGAHLKCADLTEAHLRGAILTGGAHLEGANLWRSRLEGALLWHARLHDAKLLDAHLEGVDFREAVGLTQEQLAQAFGDAKTRVADEVRPTHWPAATPR